MTTSRQQLVALALQELGIPGAGQTASAEDTAVVNARVNAVMADLAARNIWQWGDPDQIDDAAAVHLSKILANETAPAFDRAPDENKRLIAEKRLRALNTAVLSGQPQTVEYM